MNEKQRRRMLTAFDEFIKACDIGDLSAYFPIEKPTPVGSDMHNFTAEIDGFPVTADFCGMGLIFCYKGQVYA